MDAAERALLAETVHGALAACGPNEPADAALDGLGWRDMLDAEADDAINIVFTALGATNATASALDDVVAHGMGVTPRADLAVVLPPFGAWHAPGQLRSDQVSASGLAGSRAGSANEYLIVSESRGDLVAVTVAHGRAEVIPVQGIDPDAGVHTVVVETTTSSPLTAAGSWSHAVALAQRALAYEILGASRAMLDLARTHALERVQFDRAIARFQAVRHRLAEALVAIEALDAALGAARDEPCPETAALAKVIAGRTARTVAAHCQQILAGIGFTTDHRFHRYMKRTVLLDGVFGSADNLVVDIGHRLLAERKVPTLIEL
jgi:hypothetical protein